MALARRRFLSLAVGAAALSVKPKGAWAQSYPTRPVRIVVGFSAGGPSDIVARLIAQWLSERMGQSFVIDNRPGFSGNIATEAVVRAAPDGYTLLLVSLSSMVNATLYDKLSFNFLRDIAPVGTITRNVFVMEVHPSVPARTGVEFIAYAKANPGRLNMGSPGSGTGPHMASELFKMMTGINMVHVPYRGSNPMLTDLISGQVQFTFDGIASSIAHIKSGRLRALGVSPMTRLDVLPDVPSVSEFVPGYEAIGSAGLGAPRDTPADVVDALNKEIGAALADARFKERLAAMGVSGHTLSPAAYGRFLVAETEKWGKVVRFSGLKPESR
jgi:tripartite-type tricarboxylate transporter receptor subunit TctC